MRYPRPLLLSLLLTLGCAVEAAAPGTPPAPAEVTALDARLRDFPYPFPVEIRTFEAQRQTVEMAWMAPRPAEETRLPVLLLHGKNFSGAYWERTAELLLERGHRVIMPDQIGFGRSSKPTAWQYSFASMASQTADLLDDLEVERVAVVGHSMGGMLATRFTLMFPERVDRMVLVNPIGLEDWQAVVPYAPVEQVLAGELAKTPERIRAYMQESYFDGNWEPAYDELAALQMGWAISPDRDTLAHVAALTADMIFTQPVVHDFPRVQRPTRLIIGTRDRTALGKGRVDAATRAELGRYDRLGRSAVAALPQGDLVELEGIGHVPQVEAWEAYRDALVSFLDGEAGEPQAP